MSDYACVDLVSEAFHDTALLQFPSLRAIRGFRHCVTTRPWNMAPHRGPQADRAVERRKRICKHLGLPFDRLTAPDQIHSPHVLSIQPDDLGAGRDGRETALKFTDGLICGIARVPVMQFSADCPLIIAVDPVRRVFGMAHASWRGTVAGIATELIRLLRSQFHVNPKELIVGIGPCAGPTEYEVGAEVWRIAEARLGDVAKFFPMHSGKMCFDMRAANAKQLVDCGVRPDRISAASASTMSDDRFYSHRRDGADTGRFSIIAGFTES